MGGHALLLRIFAAISSTMVAFGFSIVFWTSGMTTARDRGAHNSHDRMMIDDIYVHVHDMCIFPCSGAALMADRLDPAGYSYHFLQLHMRCQRGTHGGYTCNLICGNT